MTAGFKHKILIVDDEAEARSGLAHMLRMKGYEVLEAGTGAEGLARAKSDWPSLIILDIVLPDIPGNKVLETLRADPITKAIRVLLLTAKPDIVDQMPQIEDGSANYFAKPGRAEDLLTTIQNILTAKKPQ